MAAACRRILRLSASLKCVKEKSHCTNTLKGHRTFLRKFHGCSSLAAKVAFNLSDIGEGIREVVVKEWFVKVGDKVQQFDSICEVQSDKASVTITSRYDGVIAKLHYAVDDTALVGKPLVDIETEEGIVLDEGYSSTSSSDEEIHHDTREPVEGEQKKIKVDGDGTSKQEAVTPVLCIPSVRRLAKEYSIDLTSIKGTGKGGRILKEDVLKYLEQKPDPQKHSPGDRVEPVKGFQRTMVKTMTEALKVPLFVYGDEIKVTKLSELRRTLKTLPETQEVKISFLPFLVKAVSNGLRRYPILNSSLDENCENVTYHGGHNIGIAMDTKVGLAVPVIKDAEKLSVLDIARELNRLIDTGRGGSFAPNDLSGGTFAISNIGAIGGTYMKPIPLPPQVAIIAVGSSQVLPRFDEKGNIVAEEVLNVSAAADHRIVDGATVAKFTQFLKKQIENPYLIFLGV